MKSLFLSFLLVSAALPASAADSASVSGKWSVYSTVGGNASEILCSFTQKDSELAGSCETRTGTVNISGKVDEKKVTWTYKSQYEGTPLTVIYAGALDLANGIIRITGTVDVPEFGANGTFTANQAK